VYGFLSRSIFQELSTVGSDWNELSPLKSHLATHSIYSCSHLATSRSSGNSYALKKGICKAKLTNAARLHVIDKNNLT
jgi:hypothetical protein